MNFWQKLKQSFRNFFRGSSEKKSSGGSSRSKGSSSSSASVSRGGGNARQYGDSEQSYRRALIKQRKEKERKDRQVREAFKAKEFKTATKTVADTAKSVAEKTPAPQKKTPPAIKRKPTALGTLSEKEVKQRTAKKNAAQANRKEQSRAADKLKPLIEAKYGGNTAESKRRIKSGEYMSDPDVAKYEYLKHPVASSLARGGLSGTTFGLSELAIQKLPKSKEMREAESVYQANKSRAAETAGSLAGGLLMYGGTASGFEKLGANAAARAAETQLGKRLGAETLARTMAGSGARAAITRSLVGDAIQDSTLGLIDTAANVAARDDLETPRDYLEAIAKGQAANYAMGLAGNAVAHGIPVARRMWGDFADESRKLRFVPKGTMYFMDDFVNDTMGGTRRNLIMNGGTTRSSRLQGIQSEVGFMPRRLGVKAEPPKAEPRVAREPSEILQGYSSTGSKKRLADAQNNIKQYMANGDTRAARKEVERAVDDVVRNTKIVEPMDATIREIKEELKNTRISISDKAKTDAGYKSGSFNAFRQKNFAAFRLTEDGTPVDDLWGALQERYGRSLFPDDINTESEQLQYLADIAKTTDSKIDLSDEEIAYLKDELSNSLWKSANDSVKAAAPKAPKAEPNAKAKAETKPEPPKARKHKPSKSEVRLEELKVEMKTLDDEIKRLKESGGDTIEKIREWNDLHSEATKLRKNIDRAEKAREKRATDKAMKRWEESNAKADAEKAVGVKSESPKTEVEAEPPKAGAAETSLATRNDIAKTGEEAKAGAEAETGKQTKGERTEFKRGEEETAKEKARNKRAEKRERATQESFDRDFAEFEKKVGENREKVSQLNGRLRAASTAEEKQAIKDEIRKLDEEINSLHRRAGLRYHPDMGGTDEWMQRFNTAYDDYTKRVYSSRDFSGASSKSSAGGSSTRNNTYREYRQRYKNADAKSGSTPPPRSEAGAGGGGSTPPPRGGRYADYDGLRRPRGYAKRTQRAMNTGEDLVGASRTKKTWRDAIRSAKDEANRKFVDSMTDFEQVARERKKTLGKEAMAKLYGAIDKARRYRTVATTSVGSHQMKWDGTRYQIKGEDGVVRDAPSIAEIFSGMDKETEKSFNFYLLLNHNVDRLREGTPIFENIVLRKDMVAERLGLSRGELDKLLGRGEDIDLMDADISKKLAEAYEARFGDFKDRAAQVRQYTANELNNRVQAGLLSRDMMNKWLHDHPNYVPTYREGLFDGVSASKGSAIGASDLKAAKGSDLNIYDIKEQLADATVRNWRDISLNNLLESTFGENISKLASSAEISPHMFALDHTMNVGKAADGGKYYANIYRNGKAERIEIEKRFYDDLKDLYKNGRMGNGLDALNDKALVPLANLWKNLITEWSPIFMVKNAMRDFPEAVINSRNRKEFLSVVADGSVLKDLLTNGEYTRALRDAGISTSTFIDVDKAIKAWENGEGSLKTLIPRLNAAVELFPRLAEYMATFKKAGIEFKDADIAFRDMAAANAADVTVNFGRNGSVGKMINKGFVPFFNPSVQGWSKFARNISELDGAEDTLKFLLTTTALGTAPMVATNLIQHNNPNYQQISARDKANNYIIAIPPFDTKADTFIKIPRSRFASVYGLPAVSIANENKMGWAEAIQIVNDQVAPINPLESHFGANLIQAARNKTWYGTPIESEAMQSLPANERYDATTSGISVGTAKALNKATGGRVKVSPKKLDYVLDANFGVVADVGLPLTTKAKREGNVLSQVGNVGKRAFVIDSATQNDLSTRYYDKATLLEQNKNSSEASEEDEIAYKKFSSWDSRVKAVTGAMRYIQGSDLPNKQEAYRELAKLRNENMKKALDGKVSLNNTRDIGTIHKYAGTSYTIENLGKSADQNALKAYSAAVYGELSDEAMRKKIDADTEFYKGYEGIVKAQNALQKVSPKLKGDNALTYAVGLADAGASDDVFASYNTTVKSRTETASKAQRAKDYLKNNGSIEEFAQLENAVKSLGKLSNVDKDKLEDDAYTKLKRGEMSIDEYNTELKKIDYNANQSYVGKAVSLAQSGAPARAYNLYDIKGRNVQKGYNLAAMGIDSRKYREMSQACDKDGNGYLKTAEIREYVANSDVEDKATLFDALCYYPNVRNPFGAPKHYSSEQAAEAGKQSGVPQIKVNGGKDNTTFVEGASSGGSGYGGYYRRGYRRYRRRGGGGSKVKVPEAKASAFKTKEFKPKAASKSTTRKSTAKATTSNGAKALAASLKAIQDTEAKVKPPKAK